MEILDEKISQDLNISGLEGSWDIMDYAAKNGYPKLALKIAADINAWDCGSLPAEVEITLICEVDYVDEAIKFAKELDCLGEWIDEGIVEFGKEFTKGYR
jgi:hypothetical protein